MSRVLIIILHTPLVRFSLLLVGSRFVKTNLEFNSLLPILNPSSAPSSLFVRMSQYLLNDPGKQQEGKRKQPQERTIVRRR